mgnify:CR=1 FL=1
MAKRCKTVYDLEGNPFQICDIQNNSQKKESKKFNYRWFLFTLLSLIIIFMLFPNLTTILHFLILIAIAYVLSKYFRFIRPSYIFIATVILWFLVTKGVGYFIDTLFGTVLAVALWGELREEFSELLKKKS